MKSHWNGGFMMFSAISRSGYLMSPFLNLHKQKIVCCHEITAFFSSSAPKKALRSCQVSLHSCGSQGPVQGHGPGPGQFNGKFSSVFSGFLVFSLQRWKNGMVWEWHMIHMEHFMMIILAKPLISGDCYIFFRTFHAGKTWKRCLCNYSDGHGTVTLSHSLAWIISWFGASHVTCHTRIWTCVMIEELWHPFQNIFDIQEYWRIRQLPIRFLFPTA